MTANRTLAEVRGLSEDAILKIGDLHNKRDKICSAMARATRIKTLDRLVSEWTENEYALQELWKFERDSRYHRFWDIPACRCPKMDNNDAYPTGYYVTSEACKIHWRDCK